MELQSNGFARVQASDECDGAPLVNINPVANIARDAPAAWVPATACAAAGPVRRVIRATKPDVHGFGRPTLAP
jgi:hypothetical protein